MASQNYVERMLPIDETLIQTTDWLHTARELHTVIAGFKGCWDPKVRGYDENHAEVAVAFYARSDYETKAEATKRAREMLRYCKRRRDGALTMGIYRLQGDLQ